MSRFSPRKRGGAADLLVLAGYTAVSSAYFGWRLLPHPGRVLVGYTQDPQLYVWAFAWWPHAIGSWTNPFVTHAMYAPTGVNLAWTVSVPGLALAFSPLTLLAGPVVSYNVAMLLMPALAATTAFLLCRHLTRSVWAAIVGGYLFGFCGSILREEAWGNLHVTGIFLLPLFALVVVRYLQGELDGGGLAWRFGVLIACQLSISTEFSLTVTVMLALGLVLAAWLVRDARPRIRSSLRPLAGGYAIGAVLASPLLAFALIGFVTSSFVPVRQAGSDLLNLVVPTRLVGIGGSSFADLSSRFPDGGLGLYLGLPALAIAAMFGLGARRSATGRFQLAALGLTALIALGTDLVVAGHRVFALPWRAVAHLPGLSNALPFRFAAYFSLVVAVIVATWIATTRGRIFARPYVLPLLAVAALVPAAWRPNLFHEHASHVAFFTDGLYKTCIPSGETLTIFPFGGGGPSLLWQGETNFRFRLAEDGLQPEPKNGKALNAFDRDPVVYQLNYVDVGRPTVDTLLAFAANHHVDRFVAVPGSYPRYDELRRLGSVQRIGGVWVAPACGRPSLQTRNLASYVAAYERNVRSSIGYCAGTNFIEIPADLRPSGALEGTRRATYVQGRGVTCAPPPAGYVRRGFASPDLGVPAHTYPFYAP